MSRIRVRTERVATAKPGAGIRILFASDLHLGLPWTRRCPDELILAADAESPDVVLLGGDLIDNRRGLESMEACVRNLARRRPVAAVPGNHDVAAGVENVRQGVLRAGGAWLPDGPITIGSASGRGVRICGGPIEDVDAEAINLACLHDPEGGEAAGLAGFDVAFAGHLHGGQCVLFERRGKLYPGAWVNRWTGLRFELGRLSMIVSRGMGDTLPLRWNCPREVILCDIATA